ncbi:MAG: carbohydrate ABC transporter permease [Chloroflexi bacterium]|nr:MAG: carbohydrate ABC transporter permease [Chloroflexota bacterium]
MSALTEKRTQTKSNLRTYPVSDRSMRRIIIIGFVTMFASMALFLYLGPFIYMSVTSLKSLDQIQNGKILPKSEATYHYEDEDYSLYQVPQPDGSVETWALVKKGRENSQFINPNNPEAGLIEWEGRWRALEPSLHADAQWGNYLEAWKAIEFPKLFGNTFAIAILGVIGTIISCTLVAYGFARFPIPGKNIIFLILIGTIVLPRQVTLIPTYFLFNKLGWVNTWLPLVVPHFFANAYNTFLLRQYFLSIPKELDEAAMIDGAGPFQILLRVIVPQSWPVLIAVALFHTVYAWNDYFEPLIYLRGNSDLWPISIGLQEFNFVYGTQPHLLQAASLMALGLPVLMFFLAQKFFMQGVKITGVEK